MTIKTRKVWVVTTKAKRFITGPYEQESTARAIAYRMANYGYRAIRAELRYPVKGKEK